jgi:hypothetical protein
MTERLRQNPKQNVSRTSTEEGMQTVESDLESNARRGMTLTREPDSKVTIARLGQQEKHCPPRISTDEGMRIVVREGQFTNACSPIRESFESRSKVTAESC